MALADEVEDVYEAIREDNRWDHLRSPSHKLIKGRGCDTAPLALIVGEAPNALDTARGAVFSGRSGRLLEALMSLAGLYAEDDACTGGCGSPHAQYDCIARPEVRANAFLTYVVKYRPPGNRKPTLAEQLDGAEYLRKEWAALGRPRLLVAVGAVARDVLAHPVRKPYPGEWATLGDYRTTLWVQYHPNYGLTVPDAREMMESHWEAMGEWIRDNGIC